MRIFENNPNINNMTDKDKNILMLFLGIYIFIFLISLIGFITGNVDIFGLVDGLFISLFISLGITGILSFTYYRNNAIIPSKQIIKWFALIALAIAGMLIVMVYTAMISDLSSNFGFLFIELAIIYLIMVLATLMVMLALFCFGFGMVGVVAALVRAFAPITLVHVSRITAGRAVDNVKKNKGPKMTRMDTILSWVFAIPDVLETKTIRINEGRPRNFFPWSNLYRAVFWQLLFGTVVIIYISFNPLYVKSELDFQNLFSIASNFTIIVPFFILPWFIYHRLDAKIKGQVKDYELYRGIVYRMYQTFFTLGTIIIIIRLGLQEIDNEVIFLALPTYYLFFIATITLISIIYFNYFENGLAWDVAKSYDKIKD